MNHEELKEWVTRHRFIVADIERHGMIESHRQRITGALNAMAKELVDKMTKKDVHTEHCCYRHGCKYGKDDCSVETGEKEQSHPCEQCCEEAADPIRSALQSFVDDFEGDFMVDGEIVDDPDGRWGCLTRLYNEAKEALDD